MKNKARKRTIAKELFDAWKKQTRTGDIEKLAEVLNLSRPTVINALTYGAVSRQDYIDGINKFFEERLTRERENAARLNQLANETP